MLSRFLGSIGKFLMFVGIVGVILNGGGLWCLFILFPLGVVFYLTALDCEKEETRQQYKNMYGEEGNQMYENYQCMLDTSKGKKSEYTYVPTRNRNPHDEFIYNYLKIIDEEIEEEKRKNEKK